MRLLHPAFKWIVRKVSGVLPPPLDLGTFRPDEVRSILIVSSTAIGDTLMSTPAIRSIREAYPRARIVLLARDRYRELFENNRCVDKIVSYHGGYGRFLKTLKELRREAFDLAVVLHGNSPQTVPLAYLTGARHLVTQPVEREFAYLISNRNGPSSPIGTHHAIRHRLGITKLVGGTDTSVAMELEVSAEAQRDVDAWLQAAAAGSDRAAPGRDPAATGHDPAAHGSHSAPPGPDPGADGHDRAVHCTGFSAHGSDPLWIGFQVGASKPYKQWPVESFAELGRRLLASSPRARILMLGSPKEKALCAEVARAIGSERAVSVAGRFSLTRVAALIGRLRVLVTNDTGTMHIAIALRTRTVSLFCPTFSRVSGAIQDLALHRVIEKDMPCDPCIGKKCTRPFCMEQIGVDEVFRACSELMCLS